MIWPIDSRRILEKLHSNERFAVLVVNFVDRADIGVIQCGGGLGFALEAAEGLRVFGYVVGQELESHKATELHILSFIDHTHTTAAHLLDDAIVGYGLADHWRESYFGEAGKSMRAGELAANQKVVDMQGGQI